jgi:hypothetical protein
MSILSYPVPCHDNEPDLCNNSILDLAVDSAELLRKQLLSLVHQAVEAVLDGVGAGLVATVGDDLRVVARATTVPGKELKLSVSIFSLIVEDRGMEQLTLGVSAGMSDRAPWVAIEMIFFLSLAGVSSDTAKAESCEGWRDTK